jgi:hypothetical protein
MDVAELKDKTDQDTIFILIQKKPLLPVDCMPEATELKKPKRNCIFYDDLNEILNETAFKKVL